MALSVEEEATLRRLQRKLDADRPYLELLDKYYEGVQRLEALGLAIPPALRDFVVLVNWPRLCVDAVEERLDLEGFRLPSQEDADAELWRVWQRNGLDEESQLAHVDALVFGRSFVTVGVNEDDDQTPLVTVESPLEMTVELDPRTRQVAAALKVYRQPNPLLGRQGTYATLYLPDVTIWLSTESTSPRPSKWVEDDRNEHLLGRVPVVPLVNRGRLAQRLGVSDMQDVVTLTDAAARALTNAQVATEVAAIPQRYVAGMSKGDFVDQSGAQLPVWQTYFGAVWSAKNPDTKFGQFTSADLGNFTRIVDHYAQLIAGLKGIPLRYMGQNTANPPSAEGIRADEARVVKTCERKQRAFSGSWERVMRLVRRLADDAWDPELEQLETLWRDPATPTRAQTTDAAIKLKQAGVLPVQAVWEEMGYSAARRDRLMRQLMEEQEDPTLAAIARGFTDSTTATSTSDTSRLEPEATTGAAAAAGG